MKRLRREKTPMEMLSGYEDRVDELKRQQGVVDSSKDIECSYECQYRVVPWREEDDLNLNPFLSYREAQEAGDKYYPEGYDIEDYCPEDADDVFGGCGKSVKASLDPTDRVDPKDVADYADEVDPVDDFEQGYDYDEERSDWELLERKDVKDSDGFWTNYSLYHNTVTGEYVTIFGDPDIYAPGDSYYDEEFDSEDEAYEWFENYPEDPFADDDDDDSYDDMYGDDLYGEVDY